MKLTSKAVCVLLVSSGVDATEPSPVKATSIQEKG